MAAGDGAGGAPWWLSIVTALIAGGFALLGVRWAQRHAAEQRRLDLRENRRVEQRTALAEVLTTGREWAVSLDGLVLAAAKVEEVTDTWGFDRHLPLHTVHGRALTTARLVVRD